ncbi:MAG: hypothetical protein ACLVL2_02110 [Bacteroides cellulosilyticus]
MFVGTYGKVYFGLNDIDTTISRFLASSRFLPSSAHHYGRKLRFAHQILRWTGYL